MSAALHDTHTYSRLPDLVLAEAAASLLARSSASAALFSISTNLNNEQSQEGDFVQ